MAITPETARELNKEKNKDKIESLERRIDDILVDKIKSNGSRDDIFVYIDGSDIYNLFEYIKERYNSAGWNVKFESNQRDSDYLVFIPRKNKRTYGGRK